MSHDDVFEGRSRRPMRAASTDRAGTLLLCVAAVCARGALAAAPNASPTQAPATVALQFSTPQPLNPTELLEVRSAGTAVLRARARAAEDPQVLTLLKQIQALRTAIGQLLVPHPSALQVIASPQGGTAAPAVRVPRQLARPDLAGAAGQLSAPLSALHQARLAMERRQSPAGDALSAARYKRLAAKVADLEASTQAALGASSANERYKRLVAVWRRLQVTTVGGRSASEGPVIRPAGLVAAQPSPAPTLSTIVRHRK